MEIVRELKYIPHLSLALGFFDGLHLGHQEVIACAVNFAKENNTKSAVVTFSEHPRCYLNKNVPKYVLTKNDRYKLMEKLGLDYVIELDFPSVENMTPEEYLRDVLVKYFSPVAISTGFNHHFGVNKSGDVKFLSDHQYIYNYTYFATLPETLYGDPISSTVIRGYISKGIMYMANDMLGRKFSVKGTVIEGQKIGRTIGFPTANIEYPKDVIEPAKGVYTVEVRLPNGGKYNGIANFGFKPTVTNSNIPILEVHILKFNGDLYGKEIKIKFLKYVRPEVKFNNLGELKAQILLDMQEFNN